MACAPHRAASQAAQWAATISIGGSRWSTPIVLVGGAAAGGAAAAMAARGDEESSSKGRRACEWGGGLQRTCMCKPGW